jgi:hypothetical protein
VASVVYAGGAAGWLTAQAMDTSLTLAAHTTGLTARPAPYEARVLLSSRYGGEDTVAVAFSVALGAAPPRLALSLDSLRLAGIIGQPTPPPQSVSGFNAGDVVYQPAGTSWLNTAVTGEVVTFSPNPAGLRAGQYRATVTVSSAAGGNDSLHVSLDLGQPVLGLSTRSVTFSDTVGSREVLRSQVFVSNGGSGARSDLGRIEVGTVTYSGGGSNWLHTSPASGQTVDGFVATVEAAAADVPEGTSIARVPFLSQWGGSDTVTVTLVARRPDRSFDLPTIELVGTTIVNGSPVVERLPGDSLVVTASARSPAQVGVRLGIRNSAETRLTLSGLRVGMPSYISGKGDWISGAFLNRTSATLADPAELFVAIEPAALDAGRYEAQLVVRSEAAGLAQVQPVTLRLVLRVQ